MSTNTKPLTKAEVEAWLAGDTMPITNIRNMDRVLALLDERDELKQLTLDQQHFNGRLVKECEATTAIADAAKALAEQAVRQCEELTLERNRLRREAVDPERVAQMFHEAYERLAPTHGYETRKESAKPWGDVPEKNRVLMVATCRAVLEQLAAPVASPMAAIAKDLREGTFQGVAPTFSDPTCPKCGEHLRRGPIGGGHFDWLECACGRGKGATP